jgi:hypothetical protein
MSNSSTPGTPRGQYNRINSPKSRSPAKGLLSPLKGNQENEVSTGTDFDYEGALFLVVMLVCVEIRFGVKDRESQLESKYVFLATCTSYTIVILFTCSLVSY